MKNSPLQFSKTDGLIPAIIQDMQSRAVLMLGYMNEQSLALSQKTGYVYFYSRSKQRLWKKGESSGNTLLIDTISLDCDSDALLITATQNGTATCHTGNTSCFFTQYEGEI